MRDDAATHPHAHVVDNETEMRPKWLIRKTFTSLERV
jgi:hypothetical protein